jgi:hypothetical protein
MDINWKYKTLEKLENDYWGHPNYDSYLVTRVHEIRKIPLLELTNDDIAMMLRQKFSLDYIVPLAVERIRKNKESNNILESYDEIIRDILRLPTDYWLLNKNHWIETKQLLNDKKIINHLKKTENFDLLDKIS